MSGTLYGVSVGPGDSELLTLKAGRVLRECAVIVTPQTAGGHTLALDIAQGAVDLTGKQIVKLPLPMTRDAAKLEESHCQQAAIVAEHLDAGRDVAMLNLGDVTVYSTFCYLADRLRDEYRVVMIPGVTSFCASAAELGIGLTEMNRPLHIVPASGMPLDRALDYEGTKVLMKSGKQLPEVIDALRARKSDVRAAFVQNCGLSDQVICRDISDAQPNDNYFTTIIVKERK